MNSPAKRIIILAGARVGGKMLALEIASLLASQGNKIVIVDDGIAMNDQIREVIKIRNEEFFGMNFPNLDVSSGPRNEFEKRQEWLDGFRAKHQQRARRSRK